MATKNNNQKGFTLIELLVVMGILAVLLTAVLMAINPSRQFAQARDSQRRNDVLAVLDAVQQSMADNKGVLPGSITATPTEIKTGGIDLCSELMPKYISILPSDPSLNTSLTVCPASPATYATNYYISKDSDGRVTVTANGKEIATSISVTR